MLRGLSHSALAIVASARLCHGCPNTGASCASREHRTGPEEVVFRTFAHRSSSMPADSVRTAHRPWREFNGLVPEAVSR
jgi:hypothetical protein